MFTQSFQQQGPTANDNTGLVESPVSTEPIAQHVGEDPQTLIQNMTESEFNQHLQNYPGYVRDVYEEFELDRFKRIPGRLSNLCKGTQWHLTRDEVLKMDRWMQKRGCALPYKVHQRTRESIEKNSGKTVEEITSTAFEMYGTAETKEMTHGARTNLVWESLKILEKLQGIGPSRASLLLSIPFPDTMPYFSKALFRWTQLEPIPGKFNKIHYAKLFKSLEEIRSFRNGTAVNAEKVAYVLQCNAQIEGCKDEQLTSKLLTDPTPIGPIGRGGNGEVFKVETSKLKNFKSLRACVAPCIAIKKISYQSVAMQGWYHFLTETKVSSELSKACPERFVEFFAWNAEPTAGSLYMAMEYVEFGDLEKTIEDTRLARPWTEMDMKTVTRQILEGLQHMHGALIAHRDLKPKNILVASLDKEVSIKIADFGIAKRLSNRGTTDLRTPVGSSGYRAPEVVMSWGKNSRTGYSYNADIWSVGCIVYRMAHGEAMFRYDLQVMQDERRLRGEISGHLEALKEKQQQGDVSGIRISNSGVDFIEKLMMVDPKTRPCAKKALAALKGWSCIDQGGKRKFIVSHRSPLATAMSTTTPIRI